MKGCLLLAVDDNPDNLYVLQALVAKHMPDCELLTAVSAEKGLAAALDGDLDGILIDVQMPGMSGIEMCRRLKADRRTAHLPVILITAHQTEAEVKAEALEAGADDFLTKPIDNIELLAKLKVMLRIKRTEDELRDINLHLEALVTERTRRARVSEERYRQVFEQAGDGMVLLDMETGAIVDFNIRAHSNLGYTREEFARLSIADIEAVESAEGVAAHIERINMQGSDAFETRHRRKDGETRNILVDCRVLLLGGRRLSLAVWRDITDQRRLEDQVRHAQKMEAIGRLAGGVAHDFNNVLTGIQGYTEFALERTEDGSQLHQDLSEVLALSKRAAAVVRQLLAFSRRQTLQPVVLNINTMASNLIKMLRRLIGEDVSLNFVPAADLGNVEADVIQVEQVLMNLVLNARDAMPEGGTLTIETANVNLDAAHAREHAEARAGSYVMLAVSDTGCGMDEETRARVFEPFFTTKGSRQGTGLGLATVYGIVRQHGGHVEVSSAPGEGTAFRAYFPRVAREMSDATVAGKEAPVPRGNETVLVVEDEDAVRRIVETTLGRLGYEVLVASSAEEAEEVFSAHGGGVVLLLTDLVMAGRNGTKLHEILRAKCPALKVLYMSGHVEDAIARRRALDSVTELLQKPFMPDALGRRVREVLDSRGSSRSS